jgi:hypothetical protein
MLIPIIDKHRKLQERSGHEIQQSPPQKVGFFYLMGVVAKQVAREGFSIEIQLCLNLNEVEFDLI